MNTYNNENGDLTDRDFLLFKKYIYDKVSIDIENLKKVLLRNRLKKRLKALDIGNYGEYYEFLRRTGTTSWGIL